MAFQKGQRKFKKLQRGKIPQPCRILISPVNGTVSFQAPFNEEFNKEFLAVVNHKLRLWDRDKKIWKIVPEMLTTVVEVAQRHFSKIEGLEEIYQTDYDIIGVSDDMPLEAIKATVKALRVVYAPDLAPPEMKEEYTDKIQEIADAMSRIELERSQ